MRRLVLICVLFLVGTVPAAEARELQDGALATQVAGTPRILYSGDWSGVHQIYSVDPAGRGAIAQLTFSRGDSFNPVPSPNGRRIAYLVSGFSEARYHGTGAALWVARANGSSARRLEADKVGQNVVWSPDSSQLAYRRNDTLHVVQADGSGDRIVPSAPAWAVVDPNVSPNGRWVVARTPTSFEISSRPPKTTYTFEIERAIPADYFSNYAIAWSPASRYFAFVSARGVWVVDVRTGRLRRLTEQVGFALRWAPDSKSLAFVRGRGPLVDSGFESDDLQRITLAGRVTTVVDENRAHGGTIVDLAWTRPPAGVRYRASEPASPTRVAPLGLLAGGQIQRLAADGKRVAFNVCGDVYAWTPASGDVTPLGQSGALSSCRYRTNTVVHTLAVAGDRLAYGERSGCNSITITLYLEVLAPVRRSSELARGLSNCASPNRPGVHRLTGSGGLLVYSTLHERVPEPGGPCCRTVLEEINRVEDYGCPCPVIASSPGPLAPADVDGERIVAIGDNATLMLDREGRQVLSIPISPAAAQLSGRELVLLVRGQLRVYDATTGALQRAWPLPDVPSGGTCDLQCVRGGDSSQLRLQDLARGLAAYVLDGRVHLLRLADGTDAIVGRGSHARFMDNGLVYADGSRLHLVPFDRLPLR